MRNLEEDYRGWPLSQRLEVLAFDARLAGVPAALLEALWEAIDQLLGQTKRGDGAAYRGDGRGGSVDDAEGA